MTDDIKQFKEKTLNSPALPQYFRDLVIREINDGNVTADWARRVGTMISFVESFLKKEVKKK